MVIFLCIFGGLVIFLCASGIYFSSTQEKERQEKEQKEQKEAAEREQKEKEFFETFFTTEDPDDKERDFLSKNDLGFIAILRCKDQKDFDQKLRRMKEFFNYRSFKNPIYIGDDKWLVIF